MKLMNFYRKITLILSFILITNSKTIPTRLSLFERTPRIKSKMLKYEIPHLFDISEKLAQDPNSLISSTNILKDKILSKFLDESEIKCLKESSQNCSIESLNHCSEEELKNCSQKILNICLYNTYKKCWPEYYSPENQNYSNVKTPKQFYLKSLDLTKKKINKNPYIEDNILSFYKNNFQIIIEFSLYVDLYENYVDFLRNNAIKRCLIVDYNLKYFVRYDILKFVNYLTYYKNGAMNYHYSNYFNQLFNKHSKSDYMNLLTDQETFKFDNILADEIKKDDKSKRQTTITVLIGKLLGFINKKKSIPFKLSNIKLKLVETYDLTEHNIDFDFTYEKLKIYSSIGKKKYKKLDLDYLKLEDNKIFSDNKIVSKIINTLFFYKRRVKKNIINNIKSYLKTKFKYC